MEQFKDGSHRRLGAVFIICFLVSLTYHVVNVNIIDWGWGWVEMEAFRKLLQQYLNWINQSWWIWVALGRSLGGIRAPRFRFAFFGFLY